jgi:hypothetical protein
MIKRTNRHAVSLRTCAAIATACLAGAMSAAPSGSASPSSGSLTNRRPGRAGAGGRPRLQGRSKRISSGSWCTYSHTSGDAPIRFDLGRQQCSLGEPCWRGSPPRACGGATYVDEAVMVVTKGRVIGEERCHASVRK